MGLDECFAEGKVVAAAPNPELIASLLEMSDVTEEVVRTSNITQRTVPVYVSLAYESLRMIFEALCNLHGYKVLSHICMGELLSLLLADFDIKSFDSFRNARNGINYYGRKIGLEKGKADIAKMLRMKHAMVKRHLDIQ